MATYSHSRLHTHEQCPQKYKFQYLDKLPPAHETIEAFLGSRVHETLQKLYADLQLAKVNSLEELVAFFDRQWEMEFNETIKVVRRDRAAEDYRAAGRRMLERYYRRFHPFDQETTLGLELHVVFPLAGGAQFQGYVDRVARGGDRGLVIHDYKTSGSLPSQAEIERDRQLALYEIGLRQRWPETRQVRLLWHYLAFDTDLESTRTPQQLEQARQQTLQAIGAVETARDFPPRESSLCDWCGYYNICPAKQHGRAVGALPPAEARAETGVNLVDRYVALKQEAKTTQEQIDALEAAIYDYAEKNGVTVLVGSEKQVRVHVKEQPALPTKGDNPSAYAAVVELLRGSGYWEKLSSLDRTAVGAALQSGELPKEIVRQLETLLETRTDKRLTISRREE